MGIEVFHTVISNQKMSLTHKSLNLSDRRVGVGDVDTTMNCGICCVSCKVFSFDQKMSYCRIISFDKIQVLVAFVEFDGLIPDVNLYP